MRPHAIHAGAGFAKRVCICWSGGSFGTLHNMTARACLRELICSHSTHPEWNARREAPWLYKTFVALLPTQTTANSGDLGKILATEYGRWKVGRNMALRGDGTLASLRWEKG